MKNNPFRKRTGILPSYFTGRENELNKPIKFYRPEYYKKIFL